MNNYKLKHLAKFCCKPSNELEFEAVKMAAEIGGVEWYNGNKRGNYPYLYFDEDEIVSGAWLDEKQLTPVIEFIKKLRMTEEEAEKLEDDRVESSLGENWDLTADVKVWKAINGHYFKTNEDGTEVTLHKRDLDGI